MKTFKRICINDINYRHHGYSYRIRRGKEYITTPAKRGLITVFTQFWVSDVPVKNFAGRGVFTR